MYQALSHLTVLQGTESWEGPRNEAMFSTHMMKYSNNISMVTEQQIWVV